MLFLGLFDLRLSIKLQIQFSTLSVMAKNGKTGDGHRIGAVKDRSQFQHPNGHWVKRDKSTGQIMDVKSDAKPFKGVRKEA